MNDKSEARRRNIATVAGITAAVLGVSCGRDAPLASDTGRGQQAATTAFSHPLASAPELADGYAFVDVRDAPDGSRYSLIHAVSRDRNGDEVRRSGVVATARRTLAPAERAAILATHPPGELPSLAERAHSVGHELRRRVDDLVNHGEGATLVDVYVALARESNPTTASAEVRRAIAEGRISTEDDLLAVGAQFAADRAASVSRARVAVEQEIVSLGGQIVYRCQNTYCISARIPAEAVDRVAARVDVTRLSHVEALRPEEDGDLLATGHQVRQFLDDGYDGEQDPGTFRDDIWVAVIDGNFQSSHVAFDKSSIGSRIGSRFLCDDNGCTYVTSFADPPSSDHGTKVAGTLAGNITDGQDGNWGVALDQERRSGFARNAVLRLLDYGTETSWIAAFDTIGGYAGPYEHIANLSAGAVSVQHLDSCNGQLGLSSSANQLFEAGTLLVKSAGNTSFSTAAPATCRVTAPGSAIGVFTVGSTHKTGTFPGGQNNPRGQGIQWAHSSSGSAVGGSVANLGSGRGRTIVDMTAYGRVQFMAAPIDIYGSEQGTSFAAPLVAGAAVDFIDYFQDQEYSLAYQPDVTFAYLLLMGDREACSGPEEDWAGECARTKIASGFDRRYGGGRMRMRRFDAVGLDEPSGFGNGSTCIGDGEVVTVGIPNPQGFDALHADVDDFKLVAWWYDLRHELSGDVANIDLRLLSVDAQGQNGTVLQASLHAYDNKERVYHDAVGGHRLAIELIGTDNFPGQNDWHSPLCDPGQVMVEYAWFYEEDARDDPEGPSWSFPQGVEPEGTDYCLNGGVWQPC